MYFKIFCKWWILEEILKDAFRDKIENTENYPLCNFLSSLTWSQHSKKKHTTTTAPTLMKDPSHAFLGERERLTHKEELEANCIPTTRILCSSNNLGCKMEHRVEQHNSEVWAEWWGCGSGCQWPFMYHNSVLLK